MKISDICKSITEQIEQEILACKPQFEVVKINEYMGEDESYRIETKMVINGYEYQNTNWLKYDEQISAFVCKVASCYDYIQKLWTDYPEYCKVNEILQTLRTLKVEGIGNIKLAGRLTLPNTTDNSVGGGDYDVKRVPNNVNDFFENIDKYTSLFSKTITDLQDIKKKFLEQSGIKKPYEIDWKIE